MILLYRGSWCPYCNAQLSAFQHSLGRLARTDIAVADRAETHQRELP